MTEVRSSSAGRRRRGAAVEVRPVRGLLGRRVSVDVPFRIHGRDPVIRTAEASWTLASNHRINDQIAAMGATRSKVWRLDQRPAG